MEIAASMIPMIPISVAKREFNGVVFCPACGLDTSIGVRSVRYSEEHKVVSGIVETPFVSAHTYAQEPYPHLEVFCRCGYAWITETASESVSR